MLAFEQTEHVQTNTFTYHFGCEHAIPSISETLTRHKVFGLHMFFFIYEKSQSGL